ncbi:hypothetical protein, partial [Avibacterium avium]|uniref:hypothetical protein n=1 Tax=Avibacterium avium TaxID=751 RepID=UPI003BF91801
CGEKFAKKLPHLIFPTLNKIIPHQTGWHIGQPLHFYVLYSSVVLRWDMFTTLDFAILFLLVNCLFSGKGGSMCPPDHHFQQ